MAVKRKTASSKSKRAGASKTPVVKAAATTALLLNGQAVGQQTSAEIGDQTVGQVANKIARDHGLKSYSILVNGVKCSTEEAGKPLAGAISIEVFAKETRGSL